MSEEKTSTQLKKEAKDKQDHASKKETIINNNVNIKLVRLARSLPGTQTDSIMVSDGAILEYDAVKMYLVATIKSGNKMKTFIIFPSNIAYIEIE